MIYIGNGLYFDSGSSLQHYGVKGMKWGVRHEPERSGKPRTKKKQTEYTPPSKEERAARVAKFTKDQFKISDDARKDAEEFARAKMFYGEGAGNRRKLIKSTVEAKKKRDPFYAEEFDWYLSQQKMDTHAVKAKKERKKIDTKKKVKSTARKTTNAVKNVGPTALRLLSMVHDDTDDNSLMHYGVKGMKWGVRHEPERSGKRKHKKSMSERIADKDRARQANALNNKYRANVDASVTVNKKTKKLPTNNLSLLKNYKSLSEKEYNEAVKMINRKNQVIDNVINDAYRIRRAINFGPEMFNDAIKMAKNIAWIIDRANATKMSQTQNQQQPKLSKTQQQVKSLTDDFQVVDPDDKVKHFDADFTNIKMSDLNDGNYLAHYGRKGMKWGQHIFGEDPSKVKHRPQKGSEAERDAHVKTTSADKANKATTIVAAVTLNPFAIASLARDRKAAKAMQNYLIRRNTTCKKDPETGLYLKNHEMTKDQDLQAVNPEKNSSASGVRSNCMLCTAAYDLRRRGYDVAANYAVSGYKSEAYNKWYPKGKSKKETMLIRDDNGNLRYPPEIKTNDDFKIAHAKFKDNAKKLIAEASKKEGSRGNFMVFWKYGGGHSMAYEIENNKLVIYDAQSGKKYRDADIDMILNVSCELEMMRLDNVKPDIEAMKKDGVII